MHTREWHSRRRSSLISLRLETVDTLTPNHCKVTKFGFSSSVGERQKGVLLAPGRVVALQLDIQLTQLDANLGSK